MARYVLEIKYVGGATVRANTTNISDAGWEEIRKVAEKGDVHVIVTRLAWFGLCRKVIFEVTPAWVGNNGASEQQEQAQ